VTGGHGGGDLRLVSDFVDFVWGGTPSQSCTSLEDSVYGHLTVFRADESMRTGKIMEIPPLI